MTNYLGRLCIFILVLISFIAPAWSQTVFDIGISPNRPVNEFPVGEGYHHRNQLVYTGAGFHYASSCSVIYLVNTSPGSYSLNFTYPAGDINLKPIVSLFDRWPYDPMARRYELPMGPSVVNSKNQISYRWTTGISRLSTSTLLYIIVEVPAGINGPINFPHDIYLTTPVSSPMYTLEKGVTFLSGPADMVLGGTQAPLSYAVDKAERRFDTGTLPAMTIRGDLVRNGLFSDGLNHWIPHRDRIPDDSVNTFSISGGILKIKSDNENVREGIMQEINRDVRDADSLVLMADVMVKEQTMGGLGMDGKDAPVAIAVGYKTSYDEEISIPLVFYKGFYSLKSEKPDENSGGQQVRRGQWYRNIFDLMQLDPKPVFISYISLEGSGWPVREGWIYDVHLIRTGGKE